MIDVQKILKESKRVEVTLYEPEIDSVFVKRFRKKNHLTQAALANIMGVKKKTIEKWEQGVNRVSGSSAVLLQLFDSNPVLLRERYHVETIVPTVGENPIPVSVRNKQKTPVESEIIKNSNEVSIRLCIKREVK